jgi:hypothetical protein
MLCCILIMFMYSYCYVVFLLLCVFLLLFCILIVMCILIMLYSYCYVVSLLLCCVLIVTLYSYCYVVFLLCLCILNFMLCSYRYVVFLLLYLCILTLIYSPFCILCFHRANWHSSATEVFLCFRAFRAFSSVVRQMPGYNSQRRVTARTLPNYLCCSVYCLCANVYCSTATGWQPNCS